MATMLHCRDAHQNKLNRLQNELQQASADSTNGQEVVKVLKQDLAACQEELATMQKDLMHWPISR